MKNNNKLISFVLIVAILLNAFPFLLVSASEDNEIKNNYNEYNCYAYAIGRFEEEQFYWPTNGREPRYQLGEMYRSDPMGEINYNPDDISTLTDIVENDLLSLGYTNILVYISEGNDYNINDSEINTYSEMLNSINFSEQELICCRIKDKDEFHFMKYDLATNSWYQKFRYDPIIEYTDNNGIPSNERIWCSTGVDENGNPVGFGYVYDSNIAYIIYDKLQIYPSADTASSTIVTVKGGTNSYSGKDVFYEIVVPITGCYNINLNSGQNGFNYEIYSYNMYSGDYQILSNGIDVVQVNCNLTLTATEDYESPYSVNKYYLRADFGRENTVEKYINVSISQQHTYTNGYESVSTTMHNAYCNCGAHIEEAHEIENGVCVICDAVHTHQYTDYYYNEGQPLTHEAYCWCREYIIEEHSTHIEDCPLCGAPHSHDYTDHYSRVSGKEHRSYCACGESKLAGHVVVVGSGGLLNNKICMLCLGMVEIGASIILSPTQLPRSENGSYITHDGIIVLVEDDVEAYLNGTLVFYEQNEDLEVM